MQFRRFDETLARWRGPRILTLAVLGVLLVGTLDFFSGFEISLSLFYLGPVGLATWYGDRRTGTAIAILSCTLGHVAEIAAGAQHSHPIIPIWNALVRFGFFAVTLQLLASLKRSLWAERLLARTDSLTGLCSRRAFEERLAHDLVLARRRRSVLSLAFVDLDDFKTVNDVRGHAEGDRVLQEMGRLLRESVREADTVGRIGGDEFALVLPDTNREGAEQVVGKLRSGVAESLAKDANLVTCSIGVVTFLEIPPASENALEVADTLMYEAKRGKKGSVVYRQYGESLARAAGAGRSR